MKRPLSIVALILSGALSCLLWSGPQATPTPAQEPGWLATPPSPITFLDHSLAWEWQAACAGPYRQFLADKLPQVCALEVVLVDGPAEGQLPFGTSYRGARAAGNCYSGHGSRFTCQVAVVAGDPGPALDVAVTLNAAYTLLDMFLARGADPDAVRAGWSLATFQPLLVPAEEGKGWQSACLRVWRAR